MESSNTLNCSSRAPPSGKKRIKRSSTTTTVTKVTKLVLKPRINRQSPTKLFATRYTSKIITDEKVKLQNSDSVRIRKYDICSSAKKCPSTAISAKMVNRPRNSSTFQKRESIAVMNISSEETQQDMLTDNHSNLLNENQENIPTSTSEKNRTFNLDSIEVHYGLTTGKIVMTNDKSKMPINSTPKESSNKTTAVTRAIPTRLSKTSSPACAVRKHKSYDPVKARSFMREQQLKRKEALLNKPSDQQQKNEIRQRLINLQKNSMKIVGKNLERARTVTNESKPIVNEGKNVQSSRQEHPVETNEEQNKENNPTDVDAIIAQLPKRLERSRIGILRRLEGNKQNNLSLAPKNNTDITTIERGQCVVSNLDNSQSPVSIIPIANQLELKAPETMKLHSSFLQRDNNLKQEETRSDKDPNDISFWLKPSPIQPYPYNFIMAVRKKLEAITNPIANQKRNIADNIEWIGRRSSSATNHCSAVQLESNQLNTVPMAEKTLQNNHEQTENTSNLIKSSNVIPQSIDHDSDISQNTLSISSDILSPSSPDKRQQIVMANAFIPLLTDAIPISMKNEAKDTADRRHNESHVQLVRGVDMKKNHNSRKSEAPHFNVQKMLSDFNESLSQVIKVNKKLHDVLSTPPSVQPSSVSYSDDFDDDKKDTSQYTDYESDNIEASYTVSTTKKNEPSNISEQMSCDATIHTDNTNEQSESHRAGSNSIVETNVKVRQSDGYNDENTATVTIAEEWPIHTETFRSNSKNVPDDKSVTSLQQHFSNDGEMPNTSIGSDIFAVFNRTSMEISNDIHNTSTWSEGNISYSSLGMFEQLIQTETQKSKHLASLMKLREKSIINRFKGQIAWLELRKLKLKEQGQLDEISAIKKKQRALLLRLQKDRQEIHRLMKLQKKSPVNATNVQFKISHLSTNMSIRRTSLSTKNESNSNQALKAIELEPGTGLEKILQKRENDLRSRRENVEKLLQWHQRLDDEEIEIREMERLVMMYCEENAKPASSAMQAIQMKSGPEYLNKHEPSSNSRNHEQIKEIEESLKTLHSISSRGNSSERDNSEDSVQIPGKYLNRLWKRLTGETEEKYAPAKEYVLNKGDLENMYENAKFVVLRRFDAQHDFQQLLNSSSIADEKPDNKSVSKEVQQNEATHFGAMQRVEAIANEIVPELNLDFSPEPCIKEIGPSVKDDGYYFENFEMPRDPTVESNGIAKTDVESESNQFDPENRTAKYPENDDIYSDITEDSLNYSSSMLASTIHTAPASTNDVETKPVDLDHSMQLIGDISFPHLEITSVANELQYNDGGIDDDASKNTLTPQSDDKYIGDDFESVKTSDKTALLSDNSTNSGKSESILTEIPTEKETNSDTISDSTKEDNSAVVSRSPSPRSRSPSMSRELEQRLINIDDSLKDLREAFSRSPVLELGANSKDPSILDIDSTPSPWNSLASNAKSTESTESASTLLGTTEKNAIPENAYSISALKMRGKKISVYPKIDSDATPEAAKYIRDYSIDYNKIHEADVLRQTKPKHAETEMKPSESNANFLLLRDIPNKPPPPYPTNRHVLEASPTLPSNNRIKEIVYQRIAAIYRDSMEDGGNQHNVTFLMSPRPSSAQVEQISSELSPSTEQSSNIYERIFLNICDEFMDEIRQQQKHCGLAYKQPLSFYNPPDRLACMQEYVLKRTNKLLGRSYQPYSQSQTQMSFMFVKNRRKRDLVDEILIQELMEDEQKWTNFEIEEIELQNNVSVSTSESL